MAYDTKTLKRDGSGITPVPQHFNPVADDYEPQYGRNNAGRVELFGPDGNPIASTDNKLAVRASEIETLLSTLNGRDFATQTTLATLLTKAGFDAKADIALTAFRDAIRGTESKTLTDLATALAPLATAAKQDTLAGLVSTAANQTALQNLIGTLAAAAVTDPTASAALIQLLKGLLKQLQGGGTGAAPVQLTGSKMELYGASLDDRPDATTVPIGTTFTIVDDTHDFKTWMSNGVDWGEEI